MDLPLATRAALIKRVGAVIGSDRPIPTRWEEMNVTERLLVEAADPEAAAVLKGHGAMNGELELAVISGKWEDKAPVVKSEAELREEAIAAWVEAHPVTSPEELAQRERERQIRDAQAREESMLHTQAILNAQAAEARGW